MSNWLSGICIALVFLIIFFLILKKRKIVLLLIVITAGYIVFYHRIEDWMGIYSFETSYPVAYWTDDGKKVVYLMTKEIDKVSSTGWRNAPPIKSKTYLCIMDADGENKKVVGEVPPINTIYESYEVLCEKNKEFYAELYNKYLSNIGLIQQKKLSWEEREKLKLVQENRLSRFFIPSWWKI
ncbi:MAG: hypothetical protein JW983_05935 [Elusimicrobia bacterium]|nr:hypothetical protein [Elusimicrobiota bacterium]